MLTPLGREEKGKEWGTEEKQKGEGGGGQVHEKGEEERENGRRLLSTHQRRVGRRWIVGEETTRTGGTEERGYNGE